MTILFSLPTLTEARMILREIRQLVTGVPDEPMPVIEV